jgi:hypothetical protein
VKHNLLARIIKKQFKIILLSLWGLIAFPLGVVRGGLMVVVLWGWLLPALMCAKLFGVSQNLYEVEIAVMPKTIFGWILPFILWFIIFNFCSFVHCQFKRKR